MSKSLLSQIALWLSMALMLGFPIYLIARYQHHLSEGTAYRIRTQPIDPYNPFLGRSIRLRLQDGFDYPMADSLLEYGQTIFVTLAEDSTGMTYFAGVETERPATDYFQTQVEYKGSERVTVDLPFEYYYLNEQLAPAAENLLNDWNNDSLADVSLQIRVMDGEPIMEEVYVGEVPIVEYLEGKRAQ